MANRTQVFTFNVHPVDNTIIFQMLALCLTYFSYTLIPGRLSTVSLKRMKDIIKEWKNLGAARDHGQLYR